MTVGRRCGHSYTSGRSRLLPSIRCHASAMADFAYELCHTKRRVNADELARMLFLPKLGGLYSARLLTVPLSKRP